MNDVCNVFYLFLCVSSVVSYTHTIAWVENRCIKCASLERNILIHKNVHCTKCYDFLCPLKIFIYSSSILMLLLLILKAKSHVSSNTVLCAFLFQPSIRLPDSGWEGHWNYLLTYRSKLSKNTKTFQINLKYRINFEFKISSMISILI